MKNPIEDVIISEIHRSIEAWNKLNNPGRKLYFMTPPTFEYENGEVYTDTSITIIHSIPGFPAISLDGRFLIGSIVDAEQTPKRLYYTFLETLDDAVANIIVS